MASNKFLPGVRGVGPHTQSGMLHSILSPFPDEYQVLFTDFLDLNRIPKATITDKLFNIAQKLNFFEFNTATNKDLGHITNKMDILQTTTHPTNTNCPQEYTYQNKKQ